MGFSCFLCAKLSPGARDSGNKGSDSEVSDFTGAGQVHNEEELEQIISRCKLLRIIGKARAGVCKCVQLF